LNERGVADRAGCEGSGSVFFIKMAPRLVSARLRATGALRGDRLTGNPTYRLPH
jgi:hypothetical protein